MEDRILTLPKSPNLSDWSGVCTYQVSASLAAKDVGHVRFKCLLD